MKQLHPKIQALRNAVGYKPIHFFYPRQKEYQSIPVETRSVKNDSTDERLIKQYFCIFGIPDDYRTIPIKGCFSKSLQDRGPESNAKGYKITVLNQHVQSDPLCLPTVLKEDNIGLYGEYRPDEGIPGNDALVIRVKNGTINQGSYGFNYVWDKMEYDETTDMILMKEVDLFEVSPVTIGSQKETYVKRSSSGEFVDEFLEEEMEDFIKQIPRRLHLELRTLINRHITLAKSQPLEQSQKALEDGKPQQDGLYDYLLKNLNK